LIERAFGGSVSKLILSALAAKPASQEELDAIRELLAEPTEGSRSLGAGQKRKSK